MSEDARWPGVPLANLDRALRLCSWLMVLGFVGALCVAWLADSAWAFVVVILAAALNALRGLGDDISHEIARRTAAVNTEHGSDPS